MDVYSKQNYVDYEWIQLFRYEKDWYEWHLNRRSHSGYINRLIVNAYMMLKS